MVEEFNTDVKVNGRITADVMDSPHITALTENVTALAEEMAMVYKKAYPVGSIYLSVSATSPAALFGGTWTQITNDAYLKIVTSSAGAVGGTTSDHRIPESSMPSHNHGLKNYQPSSYVLKGEGVNNGLVNQSSGYGIAWQGAIENTGGGNAYYPYYYGVYVWRRTK